MYLVIHFAVMVYGFHQLALRYLVNISNPRHARISNIFLNFQALNPITLLIFVIYIIASLTNIGLLFENNKYAPIYEVFRCMILVTAIQRLNFPDISCSTLLVAEVFFLLSGMFWFLKCLKILDITSTLTVKPKQH